MKITLTCLCGEEHVVDGTMTDHEERERRLQAAAKWATEHSGEGHGVSFEAPGVARGGPRSNEGTQSS